MVPIHLHDKFAYVTVVWKSFSFVDELLNDSVHLRVPSSCKKVGI